MELKSIETGRSLLAKAVVNTGRKSKKQRSSSSVSVSFTSRDASGQPLRARAVAAGLGTRCCLSALVENQVCSGSDLVAPCKRPVRVFRFVKSALSAVQLLFRPLTPSRISCGCGGALSVPRWAWLCQGLPLQLFTGSEARLLQSSLWAVFVQEALPMYRCWVQAPRHFFWGAWCALEPGATQHRPTRRALPSRGGLPWEQTSLL